jgi:hypothetical protein
MALSNLRAPADTRTRIEYKRLSHQQEAWLLLISLVLGLVLLGGFCWWVTTDQGQRWAAVVDGGGR